MKTVINLLICLLPVCVQGFGQNAEQTVFTGKGLGIIEQASISATNETNKRTSDVHTYDRAYYLEKSQAQKVKGLVLMTGGSVITFLGIQAGLDMSRGNSNNKDISRWTGNQSASCSRLALTGLVMMAGSIPYFLYSLKNKNKSGLKISCQKTFFGPSARACKKVNSLTFAIPLGKRLRRLC